jgi:hypothetical protein
LKKPLLLNKPSCLALGRGIHATAFFILMIVSGKHYRIIWMPDANMIHIIDQRRLP